jgi:putative autotransporter adhesin-like protein
VWATGYLNDEEPGRCFKSIGDVAVEDRLLTGFNRIEVEDKINIILTQDTVESVEVEAGSNLIPHILTRVDTGTLFISDDNTCNWLRSYDTELNVLVSVKDLREIKFTASGNITSTNSLIVNNLLIQQWDGSGSINLNVIADTCNVIMHTGSGDITISGTANYCYLYSSATGWGDCSKLVATNAFGHNNGIADIRISASNRLAATIQQTGSIYYTGNPSKIKLEDAAAGNLIEIK